MKDEIALRLKEAGFPQKTSWLGTIYKPSLDELIKELGKHFQELKHRQAVNRPDFSYPECYFCYYQIYGIGGRLIESKGDTPREAVAESYITLKKYKIIK